MQLRFQDFDTQIQRIDAQIKEQSRQMAVGQHSDSNQRNENTNYLHVSSLATQPSEIIIPHL